MSAVTVGLADGVLSITLDRPEKRNALDAAMVEELHRGLERAALDAEVRVVALRGAGKDFCAGADLAELLASRELSPAENEAGALRLGEVFLAMRRLDKPVVALVQGRALAGGCGLATACDLVVAADSAQFGYPEVQRGFVPAMVLTLLRRQVGEKVAFDLAATARLVGASEARELGLVSRVVPADRLEAEGGATMAALAAASPTALCLTKRLLYELDGPSFEEGIRLGARVNALARSTPDFRAAVEKFLS
ncbi:MAG TPA: enoyl-CoA hydratase/isomerase family protein [Gemmatimonadales bacterium]|nr:enoyl-CoA hydratase/isomerase family protein [Gemmatimonadales bacterium]